MFFHELYTKRIIGFPLCQDPSKKKTLTIKDKNSVFLNNKLYFGGSNFSSSSENTRKINIQSNFAQHKIFHQEIKKFDFRNTLNQLIFRKIYFRNTFFEITIIQSFRKKKKKEKKIISSSFENLIVTSKVIRRRQQRSIESKGALKQSE